MTENEKGIMREVYYCLRDHDDPPPLGTEACADFFISAAQALAELVTRWRRHPLAINLALAVYEYLEVKCKAKKGDSA